MSGESSEVNEENHVQDEPASSLSRREKQYACRQCTFMRPGGSRCPNWGTPYAPHMCLRHGGKTKCTEKGCTAMISTCDFGLFCFEHAGTCKVEGCERKKTTQAGFCGVHAGQKCRVEEAKRKIEYEEVRRIKRQAKLRDKYLLTVLMRQQGRCAQSLVTCAEVVNGRPTNVCPWGDRTVPYDATDLDHIQPVCEGGTDDPDNLQALCKCCHGVKSAIEARARVRPRVDEANLL